VEPLETEMGRKRTINQSSCNKDYSCIKGFCPSFVTVDGGRLRKRAPSDLSAIDELPEPPSRPSLEQPYNIAVGGVGGTGVLTIGALLGMAAHIEGRASMILDMSGLAQKGGAVLSHVRLSEKPADVTCSRIVTGTADLVIAADEVVAAASDTLMLCESNRTRGVINTHLIPTAGFVLNRDFNFQSGQVGLILESALRKDSTFFDFTRPAESLLGDSIATNMMMMGYAYQKGLLPLTAAAIEQAIAVNGVAVKMNIEAFRLGRLAVIDPARLSAMMKGNEILAPKTLEDMSLDEIVAHRSTHLADYQNTRLAEKYRAMVTRVRQAASDGGYGEALPRAVAINYAKLLAYKDEYEVARLYTDGGFEKQLSDQFEGDYKISFHLAPPMFGSKKDALGRPVKKSYDGSRMKPVFRLLARMKGLRGTPFDVFGYSTERRLERDLIAGYEKDVAFVLDRLAPVNIESAIALLSLPDRIRGYGPVKEKAVADTKVRYAELVRDFADPPPAPRQMAAE
jgi:indolepyruvate ferredoxin oxidoreductase